MELKGIEVCRDYIETVGWAERRRSGGKQNITHLSMPWSPTFAAVAMLSARTFTTFNPSSNDSAPAYTSAVYSPSEKPAACGGGGAGRQSISEAQLRELRAAELRAAELRGARGARASAPGHSNR